MIGGVADSSPRRTASPSREARAGKLGQPNGYGPLEGDPARPGAAPRGDGIGALPSHRGGRTATSRVW